MSHVRQPVVAGLFYPGAADVLAATVDGLLGAASTAGQPATRMKLRGLIVPHAGFIYSGPVAASAYALHRDWQQPEGRARWDAWLLGLWLVGPLLRKLETARFARTLATLLENGVALVPALQIAREIVGNTVLVGVVEHFREKVADRGPGLVAIHQVLLFKQARPVLDRALAVDERHDERVDARGHGLGLERLQ